MAKVRTTDGRSSKKTISDESTKTNTSKQSKQRSSNSSKMAEKTIKKSSNKDQPKKNTTKTAFADIDSGISSPEMQSRKRNSDKHSTSSKISKKSKTISKAKTKQPVTTSVVKKLSDINWMQGLIKEQSKEHPKKRRLISGIEIRYPGSLTLRNSNGVDYLSFPYVNKKCSGYVRMKAGSVKKERKAIATINFVILIGKLVLLAASKETEFKSGSLITIPKGVKYGLKNPTRDTTFLRFQTINADDTY